MEETISAWYCRVDSKHGETTWICTDIGKCLNEFNKQIQRHGKPWKNNETGQQEDPDVKMSINVAHATFTKIDARQK